MYLIECKASNVAGPWGKRITTMEHKEVEVRKLGPIVETVWGICLLAMSGVLIFIGG